MKTQKEFYVCEGKKKLFNDESCCSTCNGCKGEYLQTRERNDWELRQLLKQGYSW